MLTSKLTSKAQTTIPQPVRRALRVQPGDDLEYRIQGDEVIVRRARQPEVVDNPSITFSEWDSTADREAYAGL